MDLKNVNKKFLIENPNPNEKYKKFYKEILEKNKKIKSILTDIESETNLIFEDFKNLQNLNPLSLYPIFYHLNIFKKEFKKYESSENINSGSINCLSNLFSAKSLLENYKKIYENNYKKVDYISFLFKDKPFYYKFIINIFKKNNKIDNIDSFYYSA